MAIEKNLLSGSTTLLILKLLDGGDKYGYQMIEQLARLSNDTFALKAGTLYPLLHGLEERGMISAYESIAQGGRTRKYYSITPKGRMLFKSKQQEWDIYTAAVNGVLKGGAKLARA